ncbi:MAG: cytochrome c [Actinobacteria bacterium]|nr:cytochrome c [Actinomycetota bacterium]
MRACARGSALPLAVLAVVAGSMLASPAWGQSAPRDYTQSETEAGRRLFEAGCASCHGDNGEGGLGPDIREEAGSGTQAGRVAAAHAATSIRRCFELT